MWTFRHNASDISISRVRKNEPRMIKAFGFMGPPSQSGATDRCNAAAALTSSGADCLGGPKPLETDPVHSLAV
eukprot:3045477-Pyramimonas_sp.AAC.1